MDCSVSSRIKAVCSVVKFAASFLVPRLGGIPPTGNSVSDVFAASTPSGSPPSFKLLKIWLVLSSSPPNNSFGPTNMGASPSLRISTYSISIS